MDIFSTTETILSFKPLEVLLSISSSYKTPSIIILYKTSENYVNYEIHNKEKPSMCVICEKSITSVNVVNDICPSVGVTIIPYFLCSHNFIHNNEQYSDMMVFAYVTKSVGIWLKIKSVYVKLKAIHCCRDKKLSDSVYYVNRFHNFIVFIIRLYIKLYYVLKYKFNQHSEFCLTLYFSPIYVRTCILPLTCTDCDFDKASVIEVDIYATYIYEYSHKPRSPLCNPRLTYTATKIIILWKTSETNSTNSEKSKEKPLQCIICDSNNNSVQSMFLKYISVPHECLYESYISKPFSGTKCDYNYTLHSRYMNEFGNIYVTTILYKLHATRRG